LLAPFAISLSNPGDWLKSSHSVINPWAAGHVKQVLVALLMSQLVAGCATTDSDMRSLRAEIGAGQQQARSEQAKLNSRMTAAETQLQAIRNRSSNNAEHEGLSNRVAAIEAELKAIEKGSALAVQMGLISTVHADRNDHGIAGIRSDLDRLTEDLRALQLRIAESDRQLESGLIQLKDLSGRLR
jgi:chromosome segregation ATPase